MSTPKKPIALESSHVYLQITYSFSQPPSTSVNNPMYQVKYLGQVGELEDVGIFEVINLDGQPIKRSDERWAQEQDKLLDEVKMIDGVKGVLVMPQVKQRAKRDEF
nr:hypothetical protein L203_00978 [Cryptococcus depauperatus CBS 7841]